MPTGTVGAPRHRPVGRPRPGFLRVQYGAIARLAVVVAFLIFSSYMLRPANVHTTPVERLGALTLGTLNTVAFALVRLPQPASPSWLW